MKLRNLAIVITGLIPFGAAAEEALPPVDQHRLNQLIYDGKALEAFLEAFEQGDELTELSFDSARGVGAYIGEGRRFTRVPRADLTGPMEWANHVPQREGGANATSCIACHNAPFANGAGDVALNVLVDPAHTGDPSKYLERNTLPLFALGIPQRLAEEISMDLYLQRANARQIACHIGTSTVRLQSKGVDYGALTMTRVSETPCKVDTDTSALSGIDADLVIRPFGWKGNQPTIRAFTRNAAHNELGLQAVELVGAKDGDFDGVVNELTVGDMTALTIYMAGLERPVSKLELADLGLIELDAAERADIQAGEALFATVGCAGCHVPSMTFQDTMFHEPSMVPGFYDKTFPDGSDPAAHGLSHEVSISFRLDQDQPNNQIKLADGSTHLLGALAQDETGRPVARWFTDFKRHDMGPDLADPSDPLGLGASMFLTRSLAGVGVTGPWLHDGRATTLDEAIVAHGGDAAASAKKYQALAKSEQAQIVSFLENLTMYKSEEEEDH
ncbi:MAG: di-heme oxidoredictase family protein [Paracoccaceae bacterium]